VSSARAVGWGPTDFLIFGAPNFPDRIGVFDENFTFKGYLVTNFFGVEGMDFDAQGRLVVLNSLNPEVRVYAPSGAQVGGFTQATSPMLTPAGDVKVMPDGNYVLGTTANGARVFTPQGEFVRQYGDGDSRSIAVLPAQRLWSGNADTLTMKVFDTGSGLQVGSFILDQQTRPTYMNFSASTDTVLSIDRDRDAGGVFERDLNGALLGQFHIPIAQTTCNGATRGPGGDVFGTNFSGIIEWRPDGSIANTFSVDGFNPTRILWVGNVPEPQALALIGGYAGISLKRRTRSRDRLQF
jgi:hypothetical protein